MPAGILSAGPGCQLAPRWLWQRVFAVKHILPLVLVLEIEDDDEGEDEDEKGGLAADGPALSILRNGLIPGIGE